MNKTQIECFLKVVKEGSVQKAAQQLFLSPQAVSKYVSSLEKELNVDFFEADRQTLTRSGLDYYRVFDEVLRGFIETKRRVQLYYDQLSRNLSVGYLEWIDPFGKLDDAMSAFRKAFPQVEISFSTFTSDDIVDHLKKGALDVAFVPEQFSSPDLSLNVEKVGTEDLCYYISREGAKVANFDAPDRCFDLPFLWTSPWKAGWLEQKEVHKNVLKLAGITRDQVVLLKNFQSLCKEMEFNKGCVISGTTYSVCKNIPGVITYPMEQTASLCCMYNPLNENPLIPDFIRIVKESLQD